MIEPNVTNPVCRDRPRLLLADRVKGPSDSFLLPLLPALRERFDVRLISAPPGDTLAEAVGWADLVWVEWCWDHAVWLTRSGVLAGKPCVVRLHSVEALQTDFPARVDWTQVDRLVLVGNDIHDVVRERLPDLAPALNIQVIPNGIDLARFVSGHPDRRRVAWVGHIEPKKNPMLLLQIAHRLQQLGSDFSVHVAGAFTDLRTARYLDVMVRRLGLGHIVHFDGVVTDMPAWYADKGVLLSTSMYESFGLNIGEAMAVGAFPVVHAFPGAERLWPCECLFGTVDEAATLIRAARPNLYRNWVGERYGLELQVAATLSMLDVILHARRREDPVSCSAYEPSFAASA